jgi:hypothetical protein
MSNDSDPKENTDQSTTGKPTHPANLFRPLPTDHLIFKTGFMIGVKRSSNSSQDPSPPEGRRARDLSQQEIVTVQTTRPVPPASGSPPTYR